MDFWNLRASGRAIIPVPLDWHEELAELIAARFARRPELISDAPVLVRGTHRTHEDVIEAFSSALRKRGLDAFQGHYPQPSRVRGALCAAWAEAKAEEIEITPHRGQLHVPLLAPDVAEQHSVAGWMNLLKLRRWTYPDDGSIARFLPSELGQVQDLVDRWGRLDVRATTEGIAVPSGSHRETFLLRPPSGREVMSEVLRRRGDSPVPSDAGVVAERLIRQLGSLTEVGYLAHTELLDLLNKAARTSVAVNDDERAEGRRLHVAFIRHPEMLTVVGRAVGNDASRQRAFLEQLIARNVLRVGLVLKCDECSYLNWVEVRNLSEVLRCDRCLGEYPFPQGDPPDKRAWAYRPTGAASVEDYARGGYSVALALRFLAGHRNANMVWCTGTKLNGDLEVDFAALRTRSEEEPVLLFGEAKTHGPFKPRDFERTAELLKRYPKAVAVLATLESQLSRAEKETVTRLARPNVQRFSELPWDPRLLVLTGQELLHSAGAPQCWEEGGGRSTQLAQLAKSYVRDDVATWADITLQLHADLTPHHEWARNEADRLRSEREANAAR